MTTTSVPHERTARATPGLWRSGPLAIAVAATATALVAATARAAGVPLTIDGELAAAIVIPALTRPLPDRHTNR